MKEITTPLAKEVYLMLNVYKDSPCNEDNRGVIDVNAVIESNKRLALKVQALELKVRNLQQTLDEIPPAWPAVIASAKKLYAVAPVNLLPVIEYVRRTNLAKATIFTWERSYGLILSKT